MSEILVEFIPDFTKLESGVDKLVNDNTISKEMAALFTDAGKSLDQFGAKFAKLGGGTTLKPAIDAAKKSIGDLSKSGIKDLGELKKRVDGIVNSFTEGFGEGVNQALQDAGVSMDEFNKSVQLADTTNKSLKQSLRDINEEMAQLKISGQDNSVRYQELSKKAGEYRDALKDVTEEINRQASDTGKLDVAIRFATGLASAFSVLQGTEGLLGKNSEELQKTLLKVNSAMAILSGLQSIQNELKRKDNILTIAQTTLQKGYAAVVGESTGALKAFRIALASTGIGLLIIAVGLLVANWDKVKAAMGGVSKAQQKLIDDAEKQKQIGEDNLELLDASEESLKKQGLSEEEITKQKINQLKINKQNLIDILELRRTTLESQREAQQRSFSIVKTIVDIFTLPLLAISKTISFITGKKLPTIGDLVGNALFDPKEIDKDFKDLENKTKLETTRIQGQIDGLLNGLDDKRKAQSKKNADDNAKLLKEQLEKEAQLRQEGFNDAIAKQKLLLLKVEEGSNEELKIKKDLLRAELQLALDNDKLTAGQRKLLVQQFFKDQKDLTDKFNSDNKKRVLEDYASMIATQLAQLNLSFEEREKLTVDQLNIERELQLSAVINNKTKEAEINAKFDKEIAETRKKIHEDAFNQDLEDTKRNFEQRKAFLDATANDEKSPIEKRKAAIQELSSFEFSEFTKRRLFNQQQLKNREIDEAEFSRKAKEIDNDQAAAARKNQEKTTEIVKTENEKRLKHLQDTVAKIADFANQAIGALKGFLDTIAANEDNRIAAQKDSLERLRQNGIISQKEYEARLKVIDRLDKSNKQKQAEREKAIALFEALVNGAAAIVKAAPDPFLITATAVLVAAQVAAIAARQVPKFGKGVKSAPKGFAEVGETGTELIQMNGKYFVADHPQVIWMKGGERVYNPNETKDILTPQANMTVINNSNGHSKDLTIDYDKMAKKFGDEIAKHPRLVNNIDANGYSQYIIEGLNKSKYLNNRFRF